ncbi:MAG TPA: citrate synthase/methylcitrate synthase [Blastocatellia bacterium]
MSAAHSHGLESIVAASTRTSMVDGEAGRLVIAGYELEGLAPQATFEEMVFLLWNGRLPDAAELKLCRDALARHRQLAPATVRLLEEAASKDVTITDALVMAAPTLRIGRNEDPGEDALTVVAAFPAIVGSYWRLKNGNAPVPPREGLSHAAHFLHQVFGVEASAEQTRGLETYLNTVCDHGLNASTFTARVIMSTRSDVISAVTGAVGALKGPLHGGAPGPALDMVFEVGAPENAEPVIRAMLARGERLMGFGHRVYRVRDPRADVLAAAAERLYNSDADRRLYLLAKEVERTALRLLAEHKPGRRLQTNVEFYTALLLHGLGLPVELFTPTFAVGRALGWTAHCFEQLKEDRLIRPQSEYSGPIGLKFQPVDAR